MTSNGERSAVHDKASLGIERLLVGILHYSIKVIQVDLRHVNLKQQATEIKHEYF